MVRNNSQYNMNNKKKKYRPKNNRYPIHKKYASQAKYVIKFLYIMHINI